MDFLNFLLNLFVPPASLITLAFSWPALCFLNACEWLYNHIYGEDMDNKVVIITGASSAIGEASLYLYIPSLFISYLHIDLYELTYLLTESTYEIVRLFE
jgi:hypothetical protein